MARSGNVFQQPLNDEGKAEVDTDGVGNRKSVDSTVQVDIAVLASDRKHKASGATSCSASTQASSEAIYYVSAQGSPLKER